MKYSTALGDLETFLAIIGVISLGALGAVVASIAQDQHDRRNEATKSDVAFILNGTGLGTYHDFKVLRSFQSTRPQIGNDHVDAFCISLSGSHPNADWKKPAEIEKPFLDAVVFGLDFAKQSLPCMPAGSQLQSGHFLVQPLGFRFISLGQIDGAEVAVIDQAKNSLFYLSFQM